MGLLAGINFFSDFNKEDLKKIEMFCQDKFIKKGDYVFREGEEATAMYILAEGIIEVSKNIDGKKVVLGNVEAEEILGEMALYENSGKRMASAIAKENTKLVTILSFSIKQIESKYPDFINKIKNIITARKIENKNILGFTNNN